MSFEESVYQLRQQKLREIEALGQLAYPHKFAATHTAPQILEEFGHNTAEELEKGRVAVKVAGRIISCGCRARPALPICNRAANGCRSM